MKPYVRVPEAAVVYGRQQPICDRCAGRRVLHLGCVDAGLLEERFNRNELMHQKLAEVADELWGVDIDVDGIRFLQDRGFPNLLAGDIVDGVAALDAQHFDVVVLSEVVEHLDNPGLFLDAVFRLMTPDRTQLIVTVPNAYRIDSLLSMLRGVEAIHPDHNYWFSYYTITNLLKKRGFEIDEVMSYSLQPGGLLPDVLTSIPRVVRGTAGSLSRPPFARRVAAFVRSLPRRALVSFLYRRSAFWADGIIAVARRPA